MHAQGTMAADRTDQVAVVYRPVPLIVGLVMVAAVFGLRGTATGLSYHYGPTFTSIAPGASLFWLAHAMLLVPGGGLIGYGLAPHLGEPLSRAWRWLGVAGASSRRRTALAVGLLAFLVAGLGNMAVLRGQPLTDEELTLRFGGEVLASGALAVPVPQPAEGFVPLFTYSTPDGRITSMGWSGDHLFYGLAVATGLDHWLFAILAGIGAAALVGIGSLRHNLGLGLLGGGLMLLSPMGLTLSFTEHPHLASRCLLAATLWLLMEAERRKRWGWWLGSGVVWALAFSCRPPEVTALTLPLAVWLVVRAIVRRREEPPDWRPLVGIALGVAPVLAAVVAHHLVLSGTPWPLRMLPGHHGNDIPAGTFGHRFDSNLAYNLLMLSVWALGPLGVLLAIVGAGWDRWTRLLSAGLALDLGLALLHGNSGIHAVGPIHYSEALVVVIILSLAGIERLAEAARAHRIGLRSPAMVVLGVWIVGLGLFDVHSAAQLRLQASIQTQVKQRVADAVHEAGAERALVLTPQFARVWYQEPAYRAVGTWVFHWPRPDPRGKDAIRYAVYESLPARSRLRELGALDPSRSLFWLALDPRAPLGFRVEPLRGDSAPGEKGAAESGAPPRP